MKAAILKGYPSEIMLVSFYCLFGTIQCALVALIAERNPNAWKLSLDIELISVVYSVSKLHSTKNFLIGNSHISFSHFAKQSLVTETNFFLGSIWKRGNIFCGSMVHTTERASLCGHVQALKYCYCCLLGVHFPWRSALYWKVSISLYHF